MEEEEEEKEELIATTTGDQSTKAEEESIDITTNESIITITISCDYGNLYRRS